VLGLCAASAPPSYTNKGHYNCYADHGAIDIETPAGWAAGYMPVATCEAACTGFSRCQGFVTFQYATAGDAFSIGCWRRKDITIPNCASSTLDPSWPIANFSLYVQQGGVAPPQVRWSVVKHLNCYNGHGGTDLEASQGWAGGRMTRQACYDSCVGLTGCNAVVMAPAPIGPSTNYVYCYRRKDIVTSKCDQASDYELYQLETTPKPTPKPTPPPTPKPTPKPTPPPPTPKPTPKPTPPPTPRPTPKPTPPPPTPKPTPKPTPPPTPAPGYICNTKNLTCALNSHGGSSRAKCAEACCPVPLNCGIHNHSHVCQHKFTGGS
jgi:hypothetical protein